LPLTLHVHPFSSYTWKALIALYEKDLPFTFQSVENDFLENQEKGGTRGADFTLADCARAPSLFYANWVHPIPDDCPRVKAYRARALARPSVARAVDGARPYRQFWTIGPTDGD